MFAIYITHPQVKIDPAVPVPFWGLSDLGKERCRATLSRSWVADLGRIVSSDETKAMETAAILSAASGLRFEVNAAMGENDRSATGFLAPPEFERAADWFFAHPDESFHGWERAIDAQARIVAAVEAVLKDHDASVPIAFIGHGGVGTLLKCHLEGAPIARSADQSAGGGNLYAFALADRKLSCDWTPMESFEGWSHGKSGI